MYVKDNDKILPLEFKELVALLDANYIPGTETHNLGDTYILMDEDMQKKLSVLQFKDLLDNIERATPTVVLFTVSSEKVPAPADPPPMVTPSIVPPLMSTVVTVPKSDHVPVREPPPDAVRVPSKLLSPASTNKARPLPA